MVKATNLFNEGGVGLPTENHRPHFSDLTVISRKIAEVFCILFQTSQIHETQPLPNLYFKYGQWDLTLYKYKSNQEGIFFLKNKKIPGPCSELMYQCLS